MNKLLKIILFAVCLIFASCSNDEPDHEANLFSLAVQLTEEGEITMGEHDCEITIPANPQFITVDILGDYNYFRVNKVPENTSVTSGDKRIKIQISKNLEQTSRKGTLEFTVYKDKNWNKGSVTITQMALSPEEPDEPDGVPDKYQFKLAKSGFMPFMDDNFQVPAPFDNLSFKIVDYLDRYTPVGIPEFVEPYDSIVWSAKDMPNTVRIYERKINDSSSEEHFSARWSSHFFTPGSVMSYLKGYSDGKVIYVDSLRIDKFERDFLCFDWTKGSICIANPRTTVVYCLLDNSREYSVIDTREINGTRYSEIYALNHRSIPDENFLPTSKAILIQLMRENIGEGKSANAFEQSFKCIPKGMVSELFWENKTTRIMLLHELPSDTSLEDYSLHVEAK